jgi:hypothetical protein
MTAADRAAFTAALRQLCDAIDADPSIPLPTLGRQFCPVTFHADDSPEPAGALAIAESLGVTGAVCENRTEADEEGWPWLELTGLLGVLHVRITADNGPVMLDPVTDEGAIVRTYALGGAL